MGPDFHPDLKLILYWGTFTGSPLIPVIITVLFKLFLVPSGMHLLNIRDCDAPCVSQNIYVYLFISLWVPYKSSWHKWTMDLLYWELPWPWNPGNSYARHTETQDRCFDLIRSHQQCIPWSPPLEIEPTTTDCRAETLQLSHTSDAKLTSHGNCAA